ncbi:MAG: cellulose binding domain-containing protein [Micromonosporaceae bacterium]|nr:cellulose binding domain-containing protein [Micromonosporaceae bacterium]
MRTPTFRRAAMIAALLAASATVTGVAPGGAFADPTTTITVNARAGLATVAPTALGINDAIWDSQLGTTAVSDLLGAAGVKMIRYPGGSYGDIYHWQTHTAPGGFVAPNTDFDTFMASVQRIGAQPMIIANYGTGTPEEAAGWVRYANITKGYHANYWTIGNENYGNGYYGADWEADNHADKSAGTYAAGVVAYTQAMKAVDPNIKVGAVLTMPANWPDALVGSEDSGSWNQTVLSIAGPYIDYVDIHWYPGGSTASQSLDKAAQIDDAMFLLHQQIVRYGGPNASRLGISLTETNVGTGENTQPGALFLADVYSGLLENGVFTVDWWDVHNGIGNVSTVAGQTDYGDFGILSSGNCSSDGVTCEPALNTPFAPYFALKMMGSFAHPGDQLLRAATSDPMVSAHASRRPNGDLAVLLVNKDPDNAHAVNIGYAGYTPAGSTPTVLSYVNGGTEVTSTRTGTATSQTLPPYSLTLLTLHPAEPEPNPSAPSAVGQPAASGVTDRDVTISWPAAPGAQPGTKYEVYRQLGADSEQWGETTDTSLTVHNLVPGTRYTVNVVTRDGAGRVSPASPPVTFATGAPATSTCAVHYVDNGDWGNGYIGSIDITNTGTDTVTGWAFTFSWPRAWQREDGGWNGNWTQDGASVRVTNVDWNATIAPGATVNIGFVAGYDGPDVLPVIFALNGTTCSAS